MNLPTFKYHPDPLATDSLHVSDAECACCGQQRGYIYSGTVYSPEELEEGICPWCIADGSAHAKFEAEFTVVAGIGGFSKAPPIERSIVEEVAFRTPGFSGWQEERWLTCCGDAAAFVGCAGHAELEKQWPDAIPSIQQDFEITEETGWQHYFDSLDKEEGPTAYVFQCLHCGKHLGYSDCH